MTSWSEISQAVERVYGGERPNAAMLSFEIPIEDGARRQKVFLRHETLKGLDGVSGIDFAQIDSPIGLTTQIDVNHAVVHVGQLVVGGLGFVPTHGTDGILSLSVKLPMDFLSTDTHVVLLLLLNLVATAAAGSERLLRAPQPAERAEGAAPAGGGASTDPAPRVATGPLDEGLRMEDEGDVAGAEAAYRRGDDAGDGACATRLGCMLALHGEMDEAETAFRRGDERGDPSGPYYLGILLEDHRQDLEGAEAAWRRADERGHAGAAHNVGCLLQRRADISGAEAAWRRAADRGDGAAASNLGLLLKQRGDEAGATAAWRRADELGYPPGSVSLAAQLEQAGDAEGAEAAYRRADEQGDPDGAYGLGAMAHARGDIRGAFAAMSRAAERGHSGAAGIVALLKQEHPLLVS